jgi:hypothetical protein
VLPFRRAQGRFAVGGVLVKEMPKDMLPSMVLSNITRSDDSFGYSLLVTLFVKVMKGKDIAVHPVSAYKSSGAVALILLNLDVR